MSTWFEWPLFWNLGPAMFILAVTNNKRVKLIAEEVFIIFDNDVYVAKNIHISDAFIQFYSSVNSIVNSSLWQSCISLCA